MIAPVRAWLLLHAVLLFASVVSSYEPQERTWHHPHPDTRSPQDIMVDVINDLGLNLLKIHNTNNENNIALSPYGVASILTALLEGVKGRAAIEIQKCGGFPADRDVVRVGLRDIHRLLRSYFIPQEGFLSGLSLSSEKVTLKPEFQSILRFYGFDMTSFNTPIYPNLETTTSMSNITTMSDEETTTETTTSQTTTEQITTMPTTLPPTTMPTTLPPTTMPTTMPTTIMTTTKAETTTVRSETTLPETTVPTTTPIPTTTNRITTTGVTITEQTTMQTTTEQTARTTQTLPTITTIGTTTTNMPSTTILTTTLLPETTTQGMTTQQRTTRSVATILTTTQRNARNSETTTFPTITTQTLPTTTETIATTVRGDETTQFRIRRIGRSIVDYFIARYYDDQTPDIYNEPTNSKHAFLVNGKYQETHVHFMTYDAVLPFYYVHNLNALALRFPLDSPKYYLLLVLPVDEEGMEKLICDIGNTVTLKQIVSHMRPTYVRAVIPSFMLRGFVILTSSLQKIGIKQIFEPRHTDFSPMTDDKDIYVTNIEQAITVMIKNYMDPITINKNRNLYQYGPVEFKATHPFLYFVMDSEIDVTLVAGKIINPINSRIQ